MQSAELEYQIKKDLSLEDSLSCLFFKDYESALLEIATQLIGLYPERSDIYVQTESSYINWKLAQLLSSTGKNIRKLTTLDIIQNPADEFYKNTALVIGDLFHEVTDRKYPWHEVVENLSLKRIPHILGVEQLPSEFKAYIKAQTNLLVRKNALVICGSRVKIKSFLTRSDIPDTTQYKKSAFYVDADLEKENIIKIKDIEAKPPKGIKPFHDKENCERSWTKSVMLLTDSDTSRLNPTPDMKAYSGHVLKDLNYFQWLTQDSGLTLSEAREIFTLSPDSLSNLVLL